MIRTKLGSYDVIAKLGGGGMGNVYVGEHQLIGKRVAIKVLRPELSQNDVVVQRFFNEAKAATRINHPGIVEIFDFGHNDDGSAYLIMELLDGESLAARLRRVGRLRPDHCVRILDQIAGTLQAAHDIGIVHRDLKPDNIFLCPDPQVPGGERIKLLDFGIAKLAGPLSAGVKTRTDAIMGTPRYMAPEQCRGASEVDHRADLYALGCIAFEMVTGRVPFLHEGLGDLLAAHMFDEPPAISSLERSIPPVLERVITRLLSKQPDQRYHSGGAVQGALKGTEPPALDSARDVPSSTQGPITTLQSGPAKSPVTTLDGAVTAVPSRDRSASARRWLLGLTASGLVFVAIVLIVVFALNDDDPLAAGEASDRSPPSVTAVAPPAVAPPAERPPPETEPPRNRWSRVDPPDTPSSVQIGVSADLADDDTHIGLRPEREVYAPQAPYELQQHEVTWGELDPWLSERADAAIYRPAWVPEDAEQRERMPATGVPWETAYHYCRSIGGRLPTEAEWEYAARGPQRRPYAWGRERLDRFRTHAYVGEDGRVVPVMSKDQDRTPGTSDRALHDMMGNAREWVADLWRNDRSGGDESWVQRDGVTYRVLRGLPVDASLPETLPIEGAAYRDALCAAGSCVKESVALLAFVGFRCARDVAR